MTFRLRLMWQIFLPFLGVLVLSLVLVSWYVLSTFKAFYLGQVSSSMVQKVRLAEEQIRLSVAAKNTGEIERICRRAAERYLIRMTVLLPDDTVLCGEEKEVADASGRRYPELIRAFGGSLSVATRTEPVLGADMMSIALPVFSGGNVAAVMRAVFPIISFEKAYDGIVMKASVFAAAAILASLLIGWILSRRISRPLFEFKTAAERFARGEFDRPILIDTGIDEVASAVQALNRMAERLDERIQSIVTKGSRHEAVLASMVEGVVAVDVSGKLISVNEAAAKLLRIYQRNVEGKALQEVVRSSVLHDFAARALESETPVEDDIVVMSGEERHVHVQGAALRDAAGQKIGVILVLHDVTRLRRLESLRRDFVANVSHELKTPLTAIKGFVETLADGAVEDAGQAKNFLGIILKQTDRLNEIIEDLLTLSKIEKDADENKSSLERTDVADVLQAAVEICRSRWAERRDAVFLECDEGLKAALNPRLLEQAVVNLVDNAVKYSESGSPVVVRASRKGREVVVAVVDKGCGIAEEHLPRVFERFYRVDQARSRDVGGSGLGLAIVKHIAQTHGGYVTVRSTPGQGSEFAIHLPAFQD